MLLPNERDHIVEVSRMYANLQLPLPMYLTPVVSPARPFPHYNTFIVNANACALRQIVAFYITRESSSTAPQRDPLVIMAYLSVSKILTFLSE